MARRRSQPEPEIDVPAEDDRTMDEIQSDLQAELEMLNDPGVAHLPEANGVGGQGWTHQQDAFNPSSQSIGRSTSAPMFEHAQAFPQAKQMRVWEIKEGVPHALGLVGINATEEEFVGKFRGAMPGKFKMRPIDINGRYVGQEFTTIISSNHAALSMGSFSTETPVPTNTQSDLLMQMLEMQREELRELRLKMEDERSTIARERMELAEERTALATNAAVGVQSVAERMMQSDQARQDQINTTLTGLFQQQLQMMTAQAEAERMRARQRMDEMRQEQTFQMERERDRLAQERQKERDWHERKEKERMRQMERERDDGRARERLRKAEMDASLQREREHAERMMTMNKSDSAMGGVKKILSEFGMKPADVLDLIRGDSDGADPSIGTTIVKGITEVGKSFADAAKANVEAQAGVQAAQMQAQAQMAQIQALQNMEMDPEMMGGDFEDVPMDDPQLTGPTRPYSTQDNPELQAAFSTEPMTNPAPQAPPAPSKVELPLPTLRKARKAVRGILERLAGTPEAQWEDIITQGIIEETSIIEYMQAATIRRGLMDCGANQAFAQKVIDAINNSGLVPDSIPRG